MSARNGFEFVLLKFLNQFAPLKNNDMQNIQWTPYNCGLGRRPIITCHELI